MHFGVVDGFLLLFSPERTELSPSLSKKRSFTAPHTSCIVIYDAPLKEAKMVEHHSGKINNA